MAKATREGERKNIRKNDEAHILSNVSCSVLDWLSSIPDGLVNGHDLLTLRFRLLARC